MQKFITLREAVERAARALGLWRDRQQSVDRTTVTAGPDIVVRRDGEMLTVQPRGYGTPVRVDDLTAALVLLCHALPETRKRCPDCGGRRHLGTAPLTRSQRLLEAWDALGLEWTWLPDSRMRRAAAELCRRWSQLVQRLEVEQRRYMYRRTPCRTCTPLDGEPTGYVHQSWAEVLLDATPRQDDNVARIYEQAREQGVDAVALRDAAGAKSVMSKVRCSLDARERIAVLADDRMQRGESLGEWLALWLAAVPCRACASEGDPPVRWQGRDGRDIDCPSCRGSGLELGAHEQAIADRIDPLTWIRDRPPQVGDLIELSGPTSQAESKARNIAELSQAAARGGLVRSIVPIEHGRFEIGFGTAHGVDPLIRVIFDLSFGWRYRVNSTRAQAAADH